MPRPRRPSPPPFAPVPPPVAPGEAHWIGRRIPRPPSVNGLYRNNKDRRAGQRGRVRTSRYDGWCCAAGWELRVQGKLPEIKGGYELVILLGRRKGSDLDNYAKALSDYLKRLGVIEEDSLCESLTIRWHDGLNAKQAYFFIRPARTREVAASALRAPDEGVSYAA